VVLPGVGAFDAGVQALRARGLDKGLAAAIQNGATVLGICLGFQLLFETSEEGRLPGLGLVRGKVVKFSAADPELRVPHMGWNAVSPLRDSVLFATGPEERLRYYFVHSYYADCADRDDVTATSTHGREFACAIERGRLLGVQFHPEKSHRFGMGLFQRFLDA
jgi:glutamine amidotransferase